ncbi:hypothetical protein PHAVU_007G199300 [Phaseolus vulgaris]|uniref:Uncharacterized protein n=1 Tax=Phaseolus vulgaris TaxID=3885 RepID=V7BGK8_PHAVU|nr:hypothetical protein PHAVU_007G199300g [Phaseolus vulgaris]ESW16972.1 hypothetical protein PHAVU_007G199300g [Phaseolus vulgaris]
MQRKFCSLVKDKGNGSAGGSDNGGARFTCGTQFSRKSVGSAFSCMLANKGPPGKHASKLKKKKAFGDSGNGKAWHTNGKASCGEEPVEVAFSQLLALEETDRSGEGKQNSKDRQDVKMKLPLLSFLYKKKGWNNFTKARFSIDENGDSKNVIRLGQARRKLNLRHLFRIPSKILLFRLKLKLTKFQIKKKATEQFEQDAGDDENEDRELCKKRILMGGRCRPLSSPGYKEMYSNSWTRAQP